MQVIQLIGRYAGHLVDMPYAEARSNIDNGTAAKPGDTILMPGLALSDEAKEAIRDAGGESEPKKPAAKRAHADDGTFKADNPATPGVNEAYRKS